MKASSSAGWCQITSCLRHLASTWQNEISLGALRSSKSKQHESHDTAQRQLSEMTNSNSWGNFTFGPREAPSVCFGLHILLDQLRLRFNAGFVYLPSVAGAGRGSSSSKWERRRMAWSSAAKPAMLRCTRGVSSTHTLHQALWPA